MDINNERKISVIIPVYNKAAFIEDCVNGILGQDFDNFEIVAVDDGSTDESGAVCDRLAAADQRMRVLHTENGGVTAARRRGVEHARGRYIMFVDADDTLMPHAMRTLYDCIEREQADEVIGTFCTQHGDRSPVVYTGFAEAEPLIRAIISNKNRFCVLWGIIFRREILDGCLDTPREIIEGEDKMMQVKVLMKRPKVFFCKDCVYMYNIGLPNDRRQTVERLQLYDQLLYEVLHRWSGEEGERLEEAFSLHQVKEYEYLLRTGNLSNASRYKQAMHPMKGRLPLYEKMIYMLPPRMARCLAKVFKYVVVKLYHNV